MHFDEPRVDQKSGTVHGVVVAQAHQFRSEGRGRFTARSLERVVDLAKRHPKGLPSKFQHERGDDDGLSSYLGRLRNFRMGTAVWRELDGTRTLTDAVRADLHLDKTSFRTPRGNLGGYLLDRLENDADSLGTSLVLYSDLSFEMDATGRRPKAGPDGRALPPIWMPTALSSSDFVACGDAVDSALAAPAPRLSEMAARLEAMDRMQGKHDPRRPVNHYWKQAERHREYERRVRMKEAMLAEINSRPATTEEAKHLARIEVALTYRPGG